MRKRLLFKIALFSTPLCLCLPFFFSCANNEQKSDRAVSDSPFVQFENNELQYDWPGSTSTKKIHINRISDNFYRTSEPMELFVTSNQTFIFNLVTKKESDSKRCRYFLDDSKPFHSISLLASPDDYLFEPPKFSVFNPENRIDQIYVNLECDTSVLLQIDCRIWSSNNITGFKLSYNSTGPEDYNTINYDGFRYTGTALCPEKQFHEDFTQNMKIICRPYNYEFTDFSCKIEPQKDSPFASCSTYNSIMHKMIENNTFYYVIDLNYTFIGDFTPTKEQLHGETPTVFILRIFQNDETPEPENKSSSSKLHDSWEIGFCLFDIVWKSV